MTRSIETLESDRTEESDIILGLLSGLRLPKF